MSKRAWGFVGAAAVATGLIVGPLAASASAKPSAAKAAPASLTDKCFVEGPITICILV